VLLGLGRWSRGLGGPKRPSSGLGCSIAPRLARQKGWPFRPGRSVRASLSIGLAVRAGIALEGRVASTPKGL
jgi:hypothetical protein